MCIRCLGPFLGLFSLKFVGVLFFFVVICLYDMRRWDGEWSKGGMKGKKDKL